MRPRFLAPRVGPCAALTLAFILLAHAPASAQVRPGLRPLSRGLKQPAMPLRPPAANNQPGLASDGLLAPFGGVGNSSLLGSGVGGALPALSGQGQAGVAGLPNGGLGNYSALNPFNTSMAYNNMALSGYGAYGPFGGGYPYGATPYGGMPYGGMPYGGMPYGGMPYGGMPYGGMPYGGMPFGGYSPYGVSPYGGLPYGGMMPYGGMAPFGGMNPTGGMTPFGAINPYNGLMPSLGNFNAPRGNANPQGGGANPLGL